MKPGYKQTEVGVIPEDWECLEIGDSMWLINGRAFKPSDWQKHGTPIIRIQNLNDPNAEFNYYPGTVEERNRVEPGELLFAWSGTRGTSFGARIWAGPTGVLNQHIFKVLPHAKKLIRGYAFLALLQAQERIEREAHGFKDSFVHVKKSDLVGIEFPLPPTLAEQEAIAGALSDADTLIDSLEQLIAKKRLLKQGAMQDLLTGKKRLPGFEGEWEVKRLGDVGKCHRGVSYNPDRDLSPHDRLSTIRLLRSNNVQDSKIDLNSLQFVDSGRVSETQRLQQNDVLICMANGSRELVGKAGRFDIEDGFTYTFGAFMGCFRPDVQEIDPALAFYQFHAARYRIHIAILLAGSSINNLNPSSIEDLEIQIPGDRAEQTAIAAILSDMDAELAALEAKLAKARQVKQGMMQELLTGKTRLV